MVGWVRPLHVVVVVDDAHQEERIVTIYKPDPDQWSSDDRISVTAARYPFTKALTISTYASGCVICGTWPASGRT